MYLMADLGDLLLPSPSPQILNFRSMYLMADLGDEHVEAGSSERVLVCIKAYPDGSFDMRPGFNRPGFKYRFEDEHGGLGGRGRGGGGGEGRGGEHGGEGEGDAGREGGEEGASGGRQGGGGGSMASTWWGGGSVCVRGSVLSSPSPPPPPYPLCARPCPRRHLRVHV